MMKLLIVGDKYDASYYIVGAPHPIKGSSYPKLESVAQEIVQERIDSDAYYFDDELDLAKQSIEYNLAWSFLLSRSDFEYENVSLKEFSN